MFERLCSAKVRRAIGFPAGDAVATKYDNEPSNDAAGAWLSGGGQGKTGILISLLACLWSVSSVCTGTTYYAATNGSSGNTGLSTNSPWPLDFALTTMGASNTLVLMDGTYGQIAVPSSGVTIKALNKWSAKCTGDNPPIYIPQNLHDVSIDGIQVYGGTYNNIWANGPCTNITIRNCWIHDAAASGIEIHNQGFQGTLVEDCLFEYNGSNLTQHHGAYLAGTNITFRNNVSRYNGASGLTIGDDTARSDLFYCYNNLCYSNGTWAGVVAAGSLSGCRNYVFGNTFWGSPYAVGAGSTGVLPLTNNILVGITSPVNLWGSGSASGDYNLMNSVAFTQAHGVITNWPGFVNTNAGLYCLKADSPARSAALPTACGGVNFFGKAQSSVADIGAFQYNDAYSSDTRVLDPSPVCPDYWLDLTETVLSPPRNLRRVDGF